MEANQKLVKNLYTLSEKHLQWIEEGSILQMMDSMEKYQEWLDHLKID